MQQTSLAREMLFPENRGLSKARRIVEEADRWRQALTAFRQEAHRNTEGAKLLAGLDASIRRKFDPSAVDSTELIHDNFCRYHWALARKLASHVMRTQFTLQKIDPLTRRWLIENTDHTSAIEWAKKFFRRAAKTSLSAEDVEFCFAVFAKLEIEIGDGGCVDEYVELFNLAGVERLLHSAHLYGDGGLIQRYFTVDRDDSDHIVNSRAGYAGLVNFFNTGFSGGGVDLPDGFEEGLRKCLISNMSAMFAALLTGALHPCAAKVLEASIDLGLLAGFVHRWARIMRRGAKPVPVATRKAVLAPIVFSTYQLMPTAVVSCILKWKKGVCEDEIKIACEMLLFARRRQFAPSQVQDLTLGLLFAGANEKLSLQTRLLALKTVLTVVRVKMFSSATNQAASHRVRTKARKLLGAIAATDAGLKALTAVLSNV